MFVLCCFVYIKDKTTQIIPLSLYYLLFLTVPDTTPPIFIQCPQQPISQAKTGVYTLVSFAQPAADDNCVTVIVACTAMSSTNTTITLFLSPNGNQLQGSFPVGSSMVTCMATDEAKHTTSCTFYVVVSGTLNGANFD